METQQKTIKRGRPKKGTRYASSFRAYIDSLGYAQRAVFVATLMLELEVSSTDISRFSTSEVYHTRPNRLKIAEVAGVDFYEPPKS